MKNCRKCSGSNIRSRTNYSHGKKSKSTTTLSCKDCGSYDIEVKTNNRNYKPRRR